MANTVKLKRSSVAGKIPTTSDLQLGELALNTYDGKLFTKKNDGTESVVDLRDGIVRKLDVNNWSVDASDTPGCA